MSEFDKVAKEAAAMHGPDPSLPDSGLTPDLVTAIRLGIEDSVEFDTRFAAHAAQYVVDRLHEHGFSVVPTADLLTRAQIEQEVENDQVRRMRKTGYCPCCGADA